MWVETPALTSRISTVWLGTGSFRDGASSSEIVSSFGGGALASEGVWNEQRKFIKYNHLVANLLIYHNVVTMTKALERLAIDGHTFDDELASSVSPYQTEHINRFGRYALNHDRIPEPLDSVRALRMPPRTKRIERGANVAV
jgi:hypothetical protein